MTWLKLVFEILVACGLMALMCIIIRDYQELTILRILQSGAAVGDVYFVRYVSHSDDDASAHSQVPPEQGPANDHSNVPPVEIKDEEMSEENEVADAILHAQEPVTPPHKPAVFSSPPAVCRKRRLINFGPQAYPYLPEDSGVKLTKVQMRMKKNHRGSPQD